MNMILLPGPDTDKGEGSGSDRQRDRDQEHGCHSHRLDKSNQGAEAETLAKEIEEDQ